MKIKQTGERNNTTCLVINFPNGREEVIFGKNSGVILTESREESRLKGMPFRELFFVPELNMMFHEVRELPKLKRNGYSLGHEVAVEKMCHSYKRACNVCILRLLFSDGDVSLIDVADKCSELINKRRIELVRDNILWVKIG